MVCSASGKAVCSGSVTAMSPAVQTLSVSVVLETFVKRRSDMSVAAALRDTGTKPIKPKSSSC